MHLFDSVGERVQPELYLGNHAAYDHARLDERARLAGCQGRMQRAVGAAHAGDVGEQHQLLGADGGGQLGGERIGVDVERAPVAGVDGDGRHHRDEPVGRQPLDDAPVDVGDVADAAELVAPARLHHGPVVPREADGTPGVPPPRVDQANQLLVDAPGQHHLDDAHGLVVGHAHAVDEARFYAEAIEHARDLRPAAVHYHRV